MTLTSLAPSNCDTPTALTLIGFVADARDVRSGT